MKAFYLRSLRISCSFVTSTFIFVIAATASPIFLRALPPAATTTVLALSSSSVSSGTAATLTATVTSGKTPVIQGTVIFCDAAAAHCNDIHILGAAQLTSSGTAVINLTMGLGSHSIKAIFNGTTASAASTSAPASLTVTGQFPTSTAITATGTAAAYTLTATVTAHSRIAPTSSISFLDQSNQNQSIGSAAFSGSTAATNPFVALAPYALASDPFDNAVGDFNNDGKLDIAMVSIDGAVHILLGAGDQTFTVGPVINIGTPGQNIVAGDFNNDGKLDLALSTNAGANVVLLLGSGDGTFTQSASSPSTGLGIGPYSVISSGDFNNDGNLDLAVGSFQGDSNIAILLGNGDGTFAPATLVPIAGSAGVIAIADFNGDGILDLAVANQGSGVLSVLLGNGDGTFTAPTSVPMLGFDSFSVAAGDFNGDGKPDIVVGGVGTVAVLLGNGDGTFSAGAQYQADYNLLYWLGLGDFNGDGTPDIVIENAGFDNVTILTGNGDGTFTPVASPELTNLITAIAIGDFNGDGFADIGVSTGENNPTLTVLVDPWTTVVTAVLLGVSFNETGTHAVYASYPGDPTLAPSSSPVINLSGAAAITATDTTLTGSYATITAGTSITFTAVVAPAVGVAAPTGKVNFSDGSNLLGSGTLSNGEATYSTTALTVGAHSITAIYAGDVNFTGSTSAAVTVTVNAAPVPDFSLSISSSSGTESSTSSATATLTVIPINGFNSAVSFACSGQPAGISCAFNPATVTPAGAPVTTTVTCSGTATAMSIPGHGGRDTRNLPLPVLAIGFGGFLLACARKRRSFSQSLTVIALAASLAGIAACGSSGSSSSHSQTSTITIAATSGATSHSTTYVLTTNN